MNKEYAAGAVIFRKGKGRPLFLVIYSGRNRIWGFPKGHLEEGEGNRAAARREIREETGLQDLNFLENFREEDVYEATSNQGPYKGRRIEKHSIYFLAETGESEVRVDGEEVTGYRWLPADDAAALLSYDSLRQIFSRAVLVLRNQSPDKNDTLPG